MGILSSSTRHECKVCSKCLRLGTFFQPVTQCVRCRFYLCGHCSKPVAPDPCAVKWPFSMTLLPSRKTRRCCFSCRSSLLALNDKILRYIMLFLTYQNQDRLLRVCTRFQTVLFLPYDYVKNLEEKYLWKDPYDILYASRRSVVLRGLDRATGASHALKLIPKSQMLSRRMWQRLQQYIDVRVAASSLPTCFPAVHGVFQTHDFIVLVMELLSPDVYQPLSTLIHDVTLSESDCQRIIARVLEAVHHLHDDLHVVHRELSLDAIFVAPDNLEDIRVLRFSNSRFLHPSLHSSYLKEMMRQKQQLFRTDGATCSGIEDDCSVDSCNNCPSKSAEAAATGATGATGATAATGATGAATRATEAATGATAHVPPIADPVHSAPSPAARYAVRPPRLHIPVDVRLLRRAELYARVARDREAQLQAAATRSKGFSHDTAPEMRHSSAPLPPPGSTHSVPPMPPMPMPQSNDGTCAPEVAADDLQIVATPRAAPGYAAPEQCASLCATSVVLSLASRAGDVKKWDVFAIGGIFYRLLSSARIRNGTDDCAEWEKLSTVVSDESIVVLLHLMHVEPKQRASCREALELLTAVPRD